MKHVRNYENQSKTVIGFEGLQMAAAYIILLNFLTGS